MRRDPERLRDILDALNWIENATRDKSQVDFLADEILRYAVAQQLTVVGEAVGRLSPEIRVRHGHVPWTDIAGLRNVLVHEYFGIYWPFVWQTAVHHVPVLQR